MDLGNVQTIQTIKVYNRTDCCFERLSNFYVLVSDVPFTSTDLTTTLNQSGVSNYYTAGQGGNPTSIAVNRTGRYVRVQLSGANYLSMAEVEVIGGQSGSASTGGIRWMVTDQLGTPRISADKSGSLSGIRRHDYLPFGEELIAGSGNRTVAGGYVADAVRQKFTGYERDNETGLDYAQARYYGNSSGRFTSPDPLMLSARPTVPQSWNRYAYCLNNPLNCTDPTGLDPAFYWVTNGRGEYRSLNQEEWNRFLNSDDVLNWSPVAAGTSIGILGHVIGSDAFIERNRQFIGSGVTLGTDGNFQRETIQINQQSLLGLIRLPDFYQLEFDIPIDPEVPVLGVALQFTIDRHGACYFGSGGYVGEPGWNLTGAYLMTPNSFLPSTDKPQADELEDFIKDWGVGGAITLGTVAGGATVTKVRTGSRGVYQIGVGSPGWAVSGTSASKVTRFNFLKRILN